MTPPRHHMAPLALLIAAAASACLFPPDQSGDVTVVLRDVPSELFMDDSLVVTAVVLGPSGEEIPGVRVTIGTDNPVALSVTQVPPNQAVVVAREAEPARLIATAVGFNGAVASVDMPVRGDLAVDSVTPAEVRWGDTVVVYGIGLDEEHLFHLHIGGIPAHVKSYEGLEPRPDRYTKLVAWVPVGVDSMGHVEATGHEGHAEWHDTLMVEEEDRFEPNDDGPADLGTLAGGFHNPALALEGRNRFDPRPARDWYTFRNTAPTDRTLMLDGVGNSIVTLYDSVRVIVNRDSLGVPRTDTVANGLLSFDGQAVTSYCGPFAAASVFAPAGASVLGLSAMPAGPFDLVINYSASPRDREYELEVMNEYESDLPADAAEGNDWCDAARPLALGPSAGSFTIDRPVDFDWFSFTVPGGVSAVTVRAVFQGSDLDFLVLRDDRPDSAGTVAFGASADSTQEEATFTVTPGRYLLVVFSFNATPADYTLSLLTSAGAASASKPAALGHERAIARRTPPRLPRARGRAW